MLTKWPYRFHVSSTDRGSTIVSATTVMASISHILPPITGYLANVYLVNGRVSPPPLFAPSTLAVDSQIIHSGSQQFFFPYSTQRDFIYEARHDRH